MKLSEAIRAGIPKSPKQHFQGYFAYQSESDTFDYTKSCVLGCAILGTPDFDPGEMINGGVCHLVRNNLIRFNSQYQCPQCKEVGDNYNLSTHMNDHHKMTRESIADFWEKNKC